MSDRYVVLAPIGWTDALMIQLVDGTYRALADVHRCPYPPAWVGSRRQAWRRARRIAGDPARPVRV